MPDEFFWQEATSGFWDESRETRTMLAAQIVFDHAELFGKHELAIAAEVVKDQLHWYRDKWADRDLPLDLPDR